MNSEPQKRKCNRQGCKGTQTLTENADVPGSRTVLTADDGTLGYPYPRTTAWMCDLNREHYDLPAPQLLEITDVPRQ
jgi:hypothetical protein